MLIKLFKRLLSKLIRLSMSGLDKGPHITRYFMYKRLSELKLPETEGKDLLSVSHSANLSELLGLEGCTITEANYPDYNLLSLPFPDNSFDYVLSDQVLEHLEGDPQDAINETYRILRPGGLAIHTTCFINPIHADPSDFWRFTPDGLSLLCKNFSKIIYSEGWGNPYVWVLKWLGFSSADGIPNSKWHFMHKVAMHNDPKWPIVTWVIAQK